MTSRALQVAQTEPRGPVYMSVPREVALLPARDTTFPSASQLGIPRPAAAIPRASATSRSACCARNVRTSSCRARGAIRKPCPHWSNSATAGAAGGHVGVPGVSLFPDESPAEPRRCEAQRRRCRSGARRERSVCSGPAAPPASAYVAVIDPDPVRAGIPTYEFTADLA